MNAVEAPVIIRAAVSSDIDALTSLLQILFSIEDDFVFNEIYQRRGLQMMIDFKQACILVAEVNGRVVGMCSGQLTLSTAEGGPALLVEDMVVREEYRGKGIGSRLMEEIARWGQKKDANRLQLLADRNNSSALEFYKKTGWRVTGLICMRKRNT
ncbi:MAG TPA: GNAT family N-acetyltransferase [Desulfobacteraceae bacterium]|nr:GNAT family N-acetyltransferase [Desulfobacteraceae bacterium]